MVNSNSDGTQPCLNPVETGNQWVACSNALVQTALAFTSSAYGSYTVP